MSREDSIATLRKSTEENNESSALSDDDEPPSAILHEYQLDLFGTRARTNSLVIAREAIKREKRHSKLRDSYKTIDNALFHALQVQEINNISQYTQDKN